MSRNRIHCHVVVIIDYNVTCVCVRGVDRVFSFVFVVTQALYETGNEWVCPPLQFYDINRERCTSTTFYLIGTEIYARILQ